MSKQNMKNISKRKWPATYDTKTGKWYTGYDGHIVTVPTYEYVKDKNGELIPELYVNDRGITFTRMKQVLSDKPRHFQTEKHEIRKLTVRYSHYTRGRSAANFILIDKDDYSYETSLSGFDDLLTAIFSGLVRSDRCVYTDWDGQTKETTWFTANFVQAKQGGNIFIEYFGEAE